MSTVCAERELEASCVGGRSTFIFLFFFSRACTRASDTLGTMFWQKGSLLPLVNIYVDGRYDEGDVALSGKQKKGWSVSQVTFTARLSDELKSTSEKKEARSQAVYQQSKRLNRPAPTSRSPRLTVQKRMRKTRRVPFNTFAPPTGGWSTWETA